MQLLFDFIGFSRFFPSCAEHKETEYSQPLMMSRLLKMGGYDQNDVHLLHHT
jgi:hypothetical protein